MGFSSGFLFGAVTVAVALNFAQIKEIIDGGITFDLIDHDGKSSRVSEIQHKNKSGKIVAIDVGHSKLDYGAVSARGYTEFSFNLALARVLSKELESRGVDNFIINEDGRDIGLKERPETAKSKGADVMVSIHHDSATDGDIKIWEYKGQQLNYTLANSGYSLFVDGGNPDSLSLAKGIGSGFIDLGLTPTSYHAKNHAMIDKTNGVYDRPSLAVIKHAKIPVVLVEAGVIKNKDDEPFLSSYEGRTTIANAIAYGLEKSLND